MPLSNGELAGRVEEALEAFLLDMNLQMNVFPFPVAVMALGVFTGHPEAEVVSAVGPHCPAVDRAALRHHAYEILRRECAPSAGGPVGRHWAPVWEPPAATRRPPPRGGKLCTQFKRSGSCAFGSRCLYHHVIRPGAEDAAAHPTVTDHLSGTNELSVTNRTFSEGLLGGFLGLSLMREL